MRFLSLILALCLSWPLVTHAGDKKWLSEPHKFIGTNAWYLPLLDSPRLEQELDSLKALGIDNVRIFIGSEGTTNHPFQVSPNLMVAPGCYDINVLSRLDRLMDVLERKRMRGVFYLTNSWEWSGGYGTYLEWAGEGKSPLPEVEGYYPYINHVTHFYENSEAQKIFRDHVKFIVSRYRGRDAVASWQLCNEPRPFSKESKPAFAQWVKNTASLIKQIDPETTISIGSEGYVGCEMDMDLWKQVHSYPEIDYCTIHLWPTNWGWASRDSLELHLPAACRESITYIQEHAAVADSLDKPLVISEFGYPRDGMSLAPGSETRARDQYYRCVMEQALSTPAIKGVNFWGWGGTADLQKKEYTCDPAHEPQGLYSVFAQDSSTLNLVRDMVRLIHSGHKKQER